MGCSPWGCWESDTTERLHFTFHFYALEKEMATHSSILEGTGKPGGQPCMGSHRVGHDWSDLAAAVWMWDLDHKKGWAQRIDAFELWVWKRLLRVPWPARRSNQSVLKEINPRYSLEGLMLKLQYPLPHYVKSQFIWKDPDAGKDWGQEEKRATEDEMVGWHCQLNAHKFEPTRGASERQGSLMCCSPQGCKHD